MEQFKMESERFQSKDTRKTSYSRERRGQPRLRVKVPIKFRLSESPKVLQTREDLRRNTRHGFTLDLGLGGMKVVLDNPLRVGEVVPFDLYLLDKKDRITIYSRVQWTDSESLGLRFLLMKPQETEALRQFLATS